MSVLFADVTSVVVRKGELEVYEGDIGRDG